MVRKRHKLSDRIVPAVSLCVCSQSRFISSQYGMLDYLSDLYKPVEEVEDRLKFDPGNLQESPSYIIHGTRRCFHLHVKSVLMKYRFSSPRSSIWFSRSIDVIHDFHVPQADGESPHLRSTDTFDLLIVEFGVFEENRALKYGMAQVIANRKDRKPVWIYVPYPTIGACSKECSPELEEMVKSYEEVSISCGDHDTGPNITQAQRSSAAFSPMGKTPQVEEPDPTPEEDIPHDPPEVFPSDSTSSKGASLRMSAFDPTKQGGA